MIVIMNGWQLSDRYQDCYKRIEHGIIKVVLGMVLSWSYETFGDMYSIEQTKFFVKYVNVMLASRGE